MNKKERTKNRKGRFCLGASAVNGLKVIAFMLVFIVLLSAVSEVFVFRNDSAGRDWHMGIYKERDNSLDAVCIGSSVFYRAWMPTIAWEQYGIAVWPYFNMGQPLEAMEYYVKEIRKTQPNALFVISTNILWSTFTVDQIHNAVDNMPYTKERIELTKTLSELGGFSASDSLEFYFPLIRFHSRWNELTALDFHHPASETKASVASGSKYRDIQDLSTSYRTTDRRAEITDSVKDALESFLDYCDEESVNVLFVTLPMLIQEEEYLAMYNSVNDYVSSRGYPYLNMRDRIDEVGIDLARDYYNGNHNNLHGAFKITDYLAKYLVENYGFEDKRGDPAYADWEEAYEKFDEQISAYGCDYEWTCQERDFSLTAPELTRLAADGTTLTLSWKGVKRATGYCIYRKTGTGPYEWLADVDANTLSYSDESCELGTAYAYTVVSFREADGVRYWGTHDFNGLSATATVDTPTAFANTGVTGDLTLTWDPVPEADGYQINRRVFPNIWGTLASEVTSSAYTDTDMLDGLPYEYAVRAYWYNDAGQPLYSAWTYILYQPERPGPSVTAELADGVPVLSWPAVEGISNYTVTRRTAGGDWEQIAEPLANTAVQFRDITAQAGESYEYQVTANIVYAKQTYPYPSEPVAITAEAGPTALDPPEILFCEQVGDVVQLVWEPSANATAYRVYRQTEGEETWTVVNASIGGVTYQERPPAAGTYAYTLQPLRAESGCTYYGTFDENAATTVAYGAE